ncbi:hypothetical protein ACS0TY_003501 [Phlomoides rotata]
MEKVSSVFNGKLNILALDSITEQPFGIKGCFVFFEAVQGTATGLLPSTTT